MEKVVVNNEIYYIHKGKVCDSSFIEVPKGLADKVMESALANIWSVDIQEKELLDMPESELVDYAKRLKEDMDYIKCLRVIQYGMRRFNKSVHYYRTVFPMITSCYRSLNQPQKAISFWDEHKQLFVSCLSPALLTSLAAAYCDVGNYEMARKCANKAYAMNGGYKNCEVELTMVYMRLDTLCCKVNQDE